MPGGLAVRGLCSAVPTGPGEATDGLASEGRDLCIPGYLLTLFQVIKLSLLGPAVERGQIAL